MPWIDPDCSPGVYYCELAARFTGLQPVPRRSGLGVSFSERGPGTADSPVPAMAPVLSRRVYESGSHYIVTECSRAIARLVMGRQH